MSVIALLDEMINIFRKEELKDEIATETKCEIEPELIEWPKMPTENMSGAVGTIDTGSTGSGWESSERGYTSPGISTTGSIVLTDSWGLFGETPTTLKIGTYEKKQVWMSFKTPDDKIKYLRQIQ
eukprot:55639_1